MSTTRVYLASRLTHAESGLLPALARALEREGGVTVVSRWLFRRDPRAGSPRTERRHVAELVLMSVGADASG